MSIFGSTTEVSDRESKHKIWGVVIGIVTKNNDPSGAYRIQVRLPSHEGGGEDDKEQHSTHWARIASFSAGEYIGTDNASGPRGALFNPELGDEVIVAFEHGDILRPIILGRVWSDVGPDRQSSGGDAGAPNRPVYSHATVKGVLAGPPDNSTPGDQGGPDTKTKHQAGKNDLSGFTTRVGHKFVLNDNKDESAMYLETSKGHRVHLVDGGNKGILISDPQQNYVWLKSGSAGGDIEIKTKGNVKIDAEKDISLTAKGKIALTSQGDSTVDTQASYKLNARGSMTLKTSASGEIAASSGLKLTGNPINLN